MDPSARLANEQKKRFLAHLTKRYEDWQVTQADTALRLYDYFLSREGGGLQNTATKTSLYGRASKKGCARPSGFVRNP